MTTRRQTLRYVCLALAFGLTALALAALACGPSTPAGQDSGAAEATPTIPWLGTPPTEEYLATPRVQPTATPHPTGYVKPTDLPTLTPFPTVVWSTAPAEPRVASEQTTSTAILEEVRDFAQKEVYQDHSIARVRVGSAYRDITQASPPATYRRLTLEVLTTYRGTLPDNIEVLASLTGLPQSVLPVGDEFIAFVEKRWVLAEEDDNNPYGEGRKFGELSQQELDALGGEAYSKSVCDNV